jgi:hypothetical protein
MIPLYVAFGWCVVSAIAGGTVAVIAFVFALNARRERLLRKIEDAMSAPHIDLSRADTSAVGERKWELKLVTPFYASKGKK